MAALSPAVPGATAGVSLLDELLAAYGPPAREALPMRVRTFGAPPLRLLAAARRDGQSLTR